MYKRSINGGYTRCPLVSYLTKESFLRHSVVQRLIFILSQSVHYVKSREPVNQIFLELDAPEDSIVINYFRKVFFANIYSSAQPGNFNRDNSLLPYKSIHPYVKSQKKHHASQNVIDFSNILNTMS